MAAAPFFPWRFGRGCLTMAASGIVPLNQPVPGGLPVGPRSAKGWGKEKILAVRKGSDGQILRTTRKLRRGVIPGSRVSWLVGLAAGLAMLVLGCTMVGPDYVRPPVQVEQTWIDTADKRVKTAAADYKDWWQAFKDPALNQLIDTAYRENLTLRIAGVRVLGARAQLGIVSGQLYPQSQQATGSLQKVRISPGEVLGGSAQGASSFAGMSLAQAQAGLTASWELDFWGKFRRAIQSADASLQATIADYDNVLVSLTADVASNYILMRTLEKRLAIAKENVRIQTESLQIAQARFLGGTTSETGRGTGQDHSGQHPGDYPHPGNPVAPDQKRPVRAVGPAAARSGEPV